MNRDKTFKVGLLLFLMAVFSVSIYGVVLWSLPITYQYREGEQLNLHTSLEIVDVWEEKERPLRNLILSVLVVGLGVTLSIPLLDRLNQRHSAVSPGVKL